MMSAGAARLFIRRCLNPNLARHRIGCSVRYPARYLSTAHSVSNPVSTNAADINGKARIELAACYRLLERYDFHEGVCNHLSLMTPARSGKGEVMLMIPYGRHWSQVTASGLLGLDENNEIVEGNGKVEISAACIHRGVHNNAPNAKCVLHTHTAHTTMLACLEDPALLMVHQNSCRFYEDVAYDTSYTGTALVLEEGIRLGELIGNKQVLLMGNHGVIAVGPNVAMAFDRLYYLERACMFQVLKDRSVANLQQNSSLTFFQVMAMSTGRKLSIIPDHVAKETYKQIHGGVDIQDYADAHFYSLFEKLEKECPEFSG